jgi:hypothetical protein
MKTFKNKKDWIKYPAKKISYIDTQILKIALKV